MSLFNKDKNKQELTPSGCSDFFILFWPQHKIFPSAAVCSGQSSFFHHLYSHTDYDFYFH